MAIDDKKWDSLKKLLDDAAKDDKLGEELRAIFQGTDPELKKRKLADPYNLNPGDATEFVRLVQNVTPTLKLLEPEAKFWWW